MDDVYTPVLEIEGDGPFSFQWMVSLGLADNVSFSDAAALNPIIQFITHNGKI